MSATLDRSTTCFCVSFFLLSTLTLSGNMDLLLSAIVRLFAATGRILSHQTCPKAQRCETHKLALFLVGGRVKVSRAVSVVAILIKNNTARDF